MCVSYNGNTYNEVTFLRSPVWLGFRWTWRFIFVTIPSIGFCIVWAIEANFLFSITDSEKKSNKES